MMSPGKRMASQSVTLGACQEEPRSINRPRTGHNMGNGNESIQPLGFRADVSSKKIYILAFLATNQPALTQCSPCSILQSAPAAPRLPFQNDLTKMQEERDNCTRCSEPWLRFAAFEHRQRFRFQEVTHTHVSLPRAPITPWMDL